MTRRALASAAVACFALGCLAPRPVLYPNDTLREAQESQVDRDIDDCGALAKQYEASPNANAAGEIASRTAEDSAVGGAAGAVGARSRATRAWARQPARQPAPRPG